MKPDARKHDPRPDYLRALIAQSGLSQREIARRLGMNHRQLAYCLLPEDDPHRRVANYRTQYCIERLAERASPAHQ